jgi:hypothetical protein
MNKQLGELQKRLAKAEEDLKERVVQGSAGGGVVKVMANGQQELVAVKIEDDAMADKALLEEMIQAAANEALGKAKKLREGEMAKVTGLSMPGMY